ncbi:MAG: DUF3619 family protein [Betaproteobacteria bacterium]|nr:DUF3619 family protein [Betaproteobacteria bacterium]
MNQANDELARKIVQHLDFGADHVDQATRQRLLDARKVALSHYKERAQPVWGWAWAGHAITRRVELHVLSARHLIAAAALVAALIGIAYWQNGSAPSNELAEIDVGLLTDELPINAYLDKGFDSWLRRPSR